ncbi:Chemotaxis response regulator protein-glutamate methylesterase [archaeon HR05]|nr:Chemotaxis response regulator protein-glutamate methylesterase [archaeon HR05]
MSTTDNNNSSSNNKMINIAIINDSPYFLSILEDIAKSNNFNVIGKFTNARNALSFIYNSNYVDVILLDLEMPDMDGISFIEQVLSKRFVPIIVTTNYDESWIAKISNIGAIDFVSMNNKPINELNNMIAQKIRIAYMMNSMIRSSCRKASSNSNNNRYAHYDGKIVIIGASTGAPRIVADILTSIPPDINSCIIVVQHMPKGFTDTYVSMLSSRANIKVKRAEDRDRIVNGIVLVAPADYHLIVDNNHVRLEQGPKYAHVRPSANVTMVTAANMYGPNVIGVLLSGMGFDGAFGMKVIKMNGGFTIAQDESTSVVFGMARTACMVNAVDLILPAGSIADAIIRAVKR